MCACWSALLQISRKFHAMKNKIIKIKAIQRLHLPSKPFYHEEKSLILWIQMAGLKPFPWQQHPSPFVVFLPLCCSDVKQGGRSTSWEPPSQPPHEPERQSAPTGRLLSGGRARGEPHTHSFQQQPRTHAGQMHASGVRPQVRIRSVTTNNRAGLRSIKLWL